jgi:hypothetical protein
MNAMNRRSALVAFVVLFVSRVPAGGEKQPAAGLSGPVGVQGEPKRVRALVIDKPGVYENYLVDAEFRDVDAVRITADGVTMRNCEIRNGTKDGIEVYAADVTIENCKIHHFLAGTMAEQRDAHGITGRPTRLTVRNCEIGYVSGDCLQFDPGRGMWGDVVIEHCRLFTAPLAADAAGFKKGDRPGENALDTKQLAKNPRSKITIRDCLIHGFAKGGQINNCAGLNLKNHVEAVVERCTFYDCEIALRLRGPDEKNGGAAVTASDCTFDDVDVAIRTEDALKDCKITRPRFGPSVKQKHKNAGKAAVGFQMTEEQTVEAVKKLSMK